MASLQQTLAMPVRHLPMPNVTAVLSAIESNTDVAEFGVNVYDDEPSPPSQEGAKVTIYEVITGDEGAASIRES